MDFSSRFKKYWFFIGVLAIFLVLIAVFSKGLAIGLFLLILVSGITLFFLSKIDKKTKIPQLLFLIALLIHLLVVLFISFSGLRPFGEAADFDLYHRQGIEIANRLKQGNFSLKGLHIPHYYSVLVGLLYFFTLPQMLIPQLICAWLAAISCLLVYFICLEIGSSKKWAFLIGLLVCFYPSYLYFGSVLLKDTLIIPLILIGLLFTLKILKNFSWKHFLIFYIALGIAIHFRFYVGYALLFTFIICWFLLGRVPPAPIAPPFSPSRKKEGWRTNKKLIYGLIMVVLLGFLPQISGHGYYGIKPIKYYLNPPSITRYREVYYAPATGPVVIRPVTPTTPPQKPVIPGKSRLMKIPVISEILRTFGASEETTLKSILISFGASEETTLKSILRTFFKKIASEIFPWIKDRPEWEKGTGSSVIIKTGIGKPLKFLLNSLNSFVYVLLGPLPWQLRYYSQLVAFAETLPWYLLFISVVKGAFWTFKRYHLALPLLIFSILSLAILSLFITNFGIATRIRIPSFISLLCLIPLAQPQFFAKTGAGLSHLKELNSLKKK